MSAIATVPTKYRSVPSFQKLADSLDRVKGQNRSLRQQTEGSLGMAESGAATLVGAALSGFASGKGWSDGAVGVAAGAVAAAGVVFGQPLAVQTAVGALTPLVARWAERTAAGGVEEQAARLAA